MLDSFTHLADWLVYKQLGLSPDTPLGTGLHFFIEDTTKILVLLAVLIYFIAFIRAALNVERVRSFLQGKHRGTGYFLGSLFGAITPFCSCSSIPLFMGFISARIPVGITMAFLITSPLINEVVVIMLGSILGIKFTLMYIAIGITLGMCAGLLVDLVQGHRWLQPFLAKIYQTDNGSSINPSQDSNTHSLTWSERHQFAKSEMQTIFKRIWKWVIIGVGIGAFIHGYIPAQWFNEHLSAGQWWTVPIASLIAIPMYTNATGIVPVMASLIAKGVPLGTTLAFCMSAVAVSLPEFMMLKQVMRYRLLALVIGYLFVAISITGWLFNYFY
ncbi:permease [Photobacterium aquae]|uniref:Permease n=1 Tax=Photobacterium aquae TaxID=1195763 RepID=A0A0J1H042_9GAMM|nr:permease [Photobacterium aquae]KLV05195.1 permease [Photobacterium aquae]